MKLILFILSILSLPVIAQSIQSPIALNNEPIKPIPLTISLELDKVAIGKKLFEDPFISHNKQLSCAKCHILTEGGDDNLYRSTTQSGELDLTNTPTLFNTVFNPRHTWRGEFNSLKDHADAIIHSPRHTNTTWQELLPKLENHPTYRALFTAAYTKQAITKGMVLDSLVNYEKSLITPNAPFDKYLRGDNNAISPQAKKGYQLFKDYGCIACHQGINIGGNLFQKLGLFGDYFAGRGNITKADYGRYNVTGLEKDRFVFRVPSLRNIAVTAPYFHDGMTETLEEAMDIMIKHQLGRKISKQERTDIIIFLHSLTGEYQGKSLNPKAPTER